MPVHSNLVELDTHNTFVHSYMHTKSCTLDTDRETIMLGISETLEV